MRIALATLAAGGILLSLGIVPLWLVTTFLPGADASFLGFTFLLITPPGAIIFVIGALLWATALWRQRKS